MTKSHALVSGLPCGGGLGCDPSGCGFCLPTSLETEHVPGDVGAEVFALDAGFALDGRAVLGRHATTGLPHARTTCRCTDAGSERADTACCCDRSFQGTLLASAEKTEFVSLDGSRHCE